MRGGQVIPRTRPLGRYADSVASAPDAGRPPAEDGGPIGERLFPPHQEYPPEGDPVDEASEQSFPASDAPSTWSRAE